LPADLRDSSTLADGFARWLQSARGAPHECLRCDQPDEGLSSEMFLCDFGSTEGAIERLAFRLAPAGPGAFPSYDLSMQARAQRVAADHGVPAPVPVTFVEDTRWVGAPFLVMPAIDGYVPGSMPLHDPWITSLSPAQQGHLYESFVDQLVAIHRTAGEVVLDGLPRRGIEDELDRWAAYLAWYADGEPIVPALDRALAWCRAHRPAAEPPHSLLWGDVRLGNVIFDDRCEPVAVLDWEMAGVGAAEHDVAWWRALEDVQDTLIGQRVPGFPTLDDALARYEAGLERAMQDLPWFEVFALVRSTAVMTRLAVLQERAGRPGVFPVDQNPLLPLIERRTEDYFGS
jgi:aminoglycoside phosphotransferase (APT) family kinase protein